MAYIQFYIDGNQSYGGYISVNGSSFKAIKNDTTHEVEPGHYKLVFAERNSLVRGLTNISRAANMASSDPSLLSELYDQKTGGRMWEVSIDLEQDNEIAEIHVYTKGERYFDNPGYKIYELSDEQYDYYRRRFEEFRNTPRRNPKQMAWGAGLAIFFAWFATTNIGSLEAYVIIIYYAIALIGALLFYLGFRKILRK